MLGKGERGVKTLNSNQIVLGTYDCKPFPDELYIQTQDGDSYIYSYLNREQAWELAKHLLVFSEFGGFADSGDSK